MLSCWLGGTVVEPARKLFAEAGHEGGLAAVDRVGQGAGELVVGDAVDGGEMGRPGVLPQGRDDLLGVAGLWLVAAMMGLIGGRVIPFFTQRGLGRVEGVAPWPWLDRLLLAGSALVALLYAFGPALSASVWVGHLSRLVGPAEARAVKEGLAERFAVMEGGRIAQAGDTETADQSVFADLLTV